MKSRYVSLRKNPAGSPENQKIIYPGKGTRFGKHLFITCVKIEYTLCEYFTTVIKDIILVYRVPHFLLCNGPVKLIVYQRKYPMSQR